MSDRLLFCLGLVALAWTAQASCLVYDEDLLTDGDDTATGTPSGSPASGSGTGGMGGVGGGTVSSSSSGGPASSSSASSSASSGSSSSSGTGGGSSGIAWINEIHYDNDGGDADEGIEIAGTAGMSLSGWTLLLYNGTNGTVYDSLSLTGSLPSQQGGKGTLWFPAGQVQNGSPDGVALVDGQGQVVQFLSYEGTFAATEDAAMGMMSVDIGVEESTTTPVGQSLQLTGTGDSYASFTWSGPTTASPDQPNPGQTLQ